MADAVDSLNNLLKEVYPDGVPDLVPNSAKVQKEISFKKEDLIGDSYRPAVRLAYPSGFTHALGDGSEGAFALNDATSGTRLKAKVQGAQIVLKDQISYEDASRAVKGKRAFVDATAEIFESMMLAGRKRLESVLLYGGSSDGIGELDTSSNVNSTTTTVTFLTSDFAAGIWLGLEGASLDIYKSSDDSKLSANAAFVISSVNVDARTMTITGNSTDISALDTHLGSGDAYIHFYGAKGKEMKGIDAIQANSSTLFNINASTYSLWAGTSYSVSGAMSFAAFKKGLTKAVNKGLDEDAVLFVNPGAWDDILDDIAALRRTDKSEVKKVDIGAEEICFYSQNGKTKIIPHNFVKEGLAHLIVPRDWKRIGSRDWSFESPFGGQGKMFFHLETKAGVECRSYTDQAIICMKPARSVRFTGIVNNT